MPLLKGRIFWIDDDFGYNDRQLKQFDHMAGKFDDAVIDDNMIKFSVSHGGYLYCSYNINLLRNPIGTKYDGTYTSMEDQEYSGTLNCEKFENEKRYFLYGQ
jgi:hypothetical protein